MSANRTGMGVVAVAVPFLAFGRVLRCDMLKAIRTI
jgi:hypothetical protein